jgi:ssDNA thymidine ADP-ribosyltransferase, DarT
MFLQAGHYLIPFYTVIKDKLMATPIYHITHIDNLPSILKSNGLIANSRLRQKQRNYLDIAHENIQDRRAITPVPCGAGGYLHDYVPFYFAPRSPMLCAIHNRNVDGYSGGQKPIIHLVSQIETIVDSQIAFAFTDGHAIMAYADFYDDLNALEDVIDWELMESRYWFNTSDDPNRKCRRQAEFLLHEFCPWNLIKEIGVINLTMQTQVREILQKFNIQTPIKVYSNWYY